MILMYSSKCIIKQSPMTSIFCFPIHMVYIVVAGMWYGYIKMNFYTNAWILDNRQNVCSVSRWTENYVLKWGLLSDLKWPNEKSICSYHTFKVYYISASYHTSILCILIHKIWNYVQVLFLLKTVSKYILK